MSINEYIKKIVLLRLPEKIEGVWSVGCSELIKPDLEQKDLGTYLKPRERKIAESCYRIFSSNPVDKNVSSKCKREINLIFLELVMLLNDDIEKYYNDGNNAVPWLKNNKYLKQYTKKDDFYQGCRNNGNYKDLILEVANNYDIIQNFEKNYLSILKSSINEIIHDLRIEANLKSKQLNISKKVHLELVYLKEWRMNKKRSLESV